MTRIRIAQVGCGHWGRNLMRNFLEAKQFDLVAACDLDPGLLGSEAQYPALRFTRNYEDILRDRRIDAIALATPVPTHYAFARQALEHDKHVLVEKPLATSTPESLELVELAERRRKVLMVDHTFLYTGAVRLMKRVIDSGGIGDLLYYDSLRMHPGLVRNDSNALWDLGPHDFSIMDHLCGADAVSVSATGVRHLTHVGEDIAYVTIRLESSVTARFHLNWLAPMKVRTTWIGGSRKMIVYDDAEPTQKVKVYDRGVAVVHDPHERVRRLADDWEAPPLDNAEALHLVAREFGDSILEGRRPLTDGYAGYRIVRLLEAAQQSIEQNGREVELGETADRVPGGARCKSERA
jgi:predicted dehydrogenase